MNTKLTYIALLLYAVCYALLFGTWAAIVFNKTPGAEQIVTYIQIGLGTLSGHVLTLLAPRASLPAAPSGQGAQTGFARVGVMLMLAAAAALVLSLTGCATTASTPQTPQQVVTQVCPALQVTIDNLAALDGLDPDVRTTLAEAAPEVAAICSAATVDVGSLQSLSVTALPALIKVVNASPLDADKKAQLVLGLTAGQILVMGALQAAGAQ